MHARFVTLFAVVALAASGCRCSSDKPTPAPDPAAVATARAPSSASAAPAPLTCPDDMVLIPGGSFVFGYDDPSAHVTRRTVSVASFCLDRTEVTTAAYRACAACTPTSDVETRDELERPRHDCNQHKKGKGDHPINCVTWDQARAHCSTVGKRLPTAEEWEYAASGGPENRTYPTGNEEPDYKSFCWTRGEVGHYAEQHGFLDEVYGTCPVRSYPAQAFGLFDMAGNVAEWTSSRLPCPDWMRNDEHCRDTYTAEGCRWDGRDPQDCRAVAVSPHGGPGRLATPVTGFRCAKF